MLKTLFTIFISMLIGHSSFSQSISIGASVCNGQMAVKGDSYFKTARTGGYSFGIQYETSLKIAPNFSFSVGLEKTAYLFGYKTEYTELNGSAGYNIYRQLLALPLQLKYTREFHRFSFGALVGLRPLAAIEDESTSITTVVSSNDSIVHTSTAFGKSFHVFIDGGLILQYNTSKRMSFSLQRGYSVGFSDIYSANIKRFDLNNENINYWKFSIVYHFKKPVKQQQDYHQ